MSGVNGFQLKKGEIETPFSVTECSFLWRLNRSRAAGSLQPPAGQGRTHEVLHSQGTAAGPKLQQRDQRGGGQLAGPHDPTLQQWGLACRWILSPGQC